jgi:hypothetical protein
MGPPVRWKGVMAIVVLCPDCGKRERLPERLAGTSTVCAACGCEFPVPGEPLPTPEDRTAPADAGGQAASGGPTLQAPPPPDDSGDDQVGDLGIAAGPAPEKSRRRGLGVGTWALLGIGGLIAGWLITWAVYAAMHDWKLAQDRSAASQLKADADLLAAENHLPEARTKYQELTDFLARRAAQDPFLNQMADETVATARNVERILAARAAAAARAVASRSQVIAIPAPAVPSTAPVEVIPPASSPPPRRAPAPQPVAIAPPAPAGRPPVRAMNDASNELSDEQIGQAIQRGVNFLIGEFDPKAFELRDGMTPRGGPRNELSAYHDGADVICVYALMQCGDAISDPRLNIRGPFMTGCMEAMKTYPLNDHFGTYTRGLRATALALKGRKEDQKTLKNDVATLLKTSIKGAFGYYDMTTQLHSTSWDNSNSQYGLLGIWSGAEADPPAEVPNLFWVEAQNHWTSCQCPNGQWGYISRNGGGNLTMTCAGLASMFVCHDWLDAPKFGAAVGREPFSPALRAGLAWLEQGNNSVAINSQWWGYALYGVERVGLASGFKFFGNHNWYPELARQVLQRQRPDGSWGRGEDVVDTAYALLFLSRGRHPILMNKLRFNGAWANRPRDAANLSRYASAQLERPLNWQVVPLAVDWTQWMDSPILYLASHQPPNLSDEDIDKIRNYVNAGGMLFVQADGNAPAMAGFAAALARRLFPLYEMSAVPPGHPLFSSVYRLTSPPPLKMVSNGSRILMLFSPTDLSKSWQLREQRTLAGKPIFQFGINLFIYATGRRDLRNRLETNVIPAVADDGKMTIKIARVKYGGDWDPEPYAWTRFSRWFQRRTSYALDVQSVPMRDLDAKVWPFAHLTGAFRYDPTPGEVAAAKKYVESGGVLLIDMTGGAGTFAESIRTSLIAAAFPTARSVIVRASHPLLRSGPGGMEDLSRIRLRPYTIEKFGSTSDGLELFAAGKGHVLMTSMDLTSGLLNTGTWGIIGYEPGYAQNLMKNMIFWTVDGQKE